MKTFTTLVTLTLAACKMTGAIAQDNTSKTTIGGYAEGFYSKSILKDTRMNGKAEMLRLVTFLGHQFNPKTSFHSEIEVEHATEIYIEQAYLKYDINDFLSFKGGLILIPMGIINEYHESGTYNGVFRPTVDKVIVPSTWREMGAGFSGNITSASIKYQAYVVNGFLSYNTAGTLDAKEGLRKGRQKAFNATVSSPNYSGKVDYYGIKGLTVGLSAYYGNTQSNAYDKLASSNEASKLSADSTVLGVAMYGADARYTLGAFQARGQFIYSTLSNTEQYNKKTNIKNKLGSAMMGYYAEAGVDLLKAFDSNSKNGLVAFARYENYDTHAAVAGSLTRDDAYNRTDITLGLGFKVSENAVFKADYQILSNKKDKDEKVADLVNVGIGVNF